MNKHYEALELPKILEKLAILPPVQTRMRLGRLHLSRKPSITRRKGCCGKPKRRISSSPNSARRRSAGCKTSAERCAVPRRGATLTMRALLDIAGVLRAVRGICTWREKSAGTESALDDLFGSLYANKYLEDLICNAILSEEEMSDNASPQLKDIRRKKRAQDARIREQLERLLRSPAYKNSLQDALVTQRGGRFVVPVKAEHRAEVPGLVHDYVVKRLYGVHRTRCRGGGEQRDQGARKPRAR